MAELYEVATGHNNTGGYGTLTPQPKMLGMRVGRRVQTGDENFYDDGYKNCELKWGYLTKAQFTTLCTAFGVGDGTPGALVTIRLPRNVGRAFADHNATVVMPDLPDEASYDMTVYQDIRFRVVNIREI